MIKKCIYKFKSFRVQFYVLHVFEIGKCAFQQFDVRVKTLSDRFKDDHVCQESGKLPVKFHSVLSYNLKHIDKDVESFNIFKGLLVDNAETFQKLIVVTFEGSFNDFLSLEVAEFEYHLSTDLSVSFYYGFYEIDKISFIGFVQLDYHTCIYQIH